MISALLWEATNANLLSYGSYALSCADHTLRSYDWLHLNRCVNEAHDLWSHLICIQKRLSLPQCVLFAQLAEEHIIFSPVHLNLQKHSCICKSGLQIDSEIVYGSFEQWVVLDTKMPMQRNSDQKTDAEQQRSTIDEPRRRNVARLAKRSQRYDVLRDKVRNARQLLLSIATSMWMLMLGPWTHFFETTRTDIHCVLRWRT